MSENTNTTALSPEAELEKLEQDAIDGKHVTAEQLATARAKIDLFGFIRKGQEKRDQLAAEEAAEKARADAKETVAGSLDGAPDKLLAAYDKAVAALEGLFTAHSIYQGKIQEAGDLLTRAKVPARGYVHEPVPDHYDPLFSAHWADGGVVAAVTVKGVAHTAGPVDEWARAAVYGVLQAHSETRNLAFKLGSAYTPRLLDERKD